ncbi:MAG: alpha/beta fold hydrolase [Phycisphaerales bacterium]|nr:alpha/beta fold hydrolase [Phycisphaerales bacterium]
MTEEHHTTSGKAKRKRSLGKRLLRMLVVYLCVSVVGIVVLWVTGYGERLFYFPVRDAFETPAQYEDVWIETADGKRLHGWFMPAVGVPDGERAPTILHAHGNAGNVLYHESYSSFLTMSGFHVLLFDYRGYGRSDKGSLNRETLTIDTRSALAYLMERDDVDPDRVGVMGVSLGGPFALDAAIDETRVEAVVTVSTFASWRGIATDAVGIAGVLIPTGLDPVDLARGLGSRPYLIMHGTGDEIIDVKHAEEIRASAEDSFVDVTMRTYPGDHNSLIQHDLEAQRDLAGFFQKYLGSE